ncbi:MAG: methyltransferase domain-containing protein, partial [Candidatus Aenigmatarchaeota archaeon]
MFTPYIYSDWMREIQEKKFEGLFIDFILPLKSELNFNSIKMLDVGIGKGWFEDKFKDRNMNPDIFGLDIETFKPSKNFERVVGDGNLLPFKNSTFDLLVSVDTMHLIDNPREVFRVMKNNSFAILGIFSSPYNLNEKRKELLTKAKNLNLLKESVVGDPK